MYVYDDMVWLVDSLSTGGKAPEAVLSAASIHLVTHQSQLPSEFLYPSPHNQFIIGIDCEGVHLCRHGTLCIMQVFLFLP